MAEFTLELLTFARAVFTWAAKSKRMSWPEFNAKMRNVIWHERRLIGCQGKHGFTSMVQADRMAQKSGKNGHRSRVAYRCRVCNLFHVGHREADLRRLRDREFAKRRIRAAEMEMA